LAQHFSQFPLKVSVSGIRALRSRSDQAAPYMRTQFSSANKLARFGKIEAVITMRVMLVYHALRSHLTMWLFKYSTPEFRIGPEDVCRLTPRRSISASALSKRVVVFKALTYIAIVPHMVSRDSGTSSPNLSRIPQMGRAT